MLCIKIFGRNLLVVRTLIFFTVLLLLVICVITIFKKPVEYKQKYNDKEIKQALTYINSLYLKFNYIQSKKEDSLTYFSDERIKIDSEYYDIINKIMLTEEIYFKLDSLTAYKVILQ